MYSCYFFGHSSSSNPSKSKSSVSEMNNWTDDVMMQIDVISKTHFHVTDHTNKAVGCLLPPKVWDCAISELFCLWISACVFSVVYVTDATRTSTFYTQKIKIACR